MKQYTIIKTGYSSGVYGCSAEYFTLIVFDTDKQKTYPDIHHFWGLYGAEDRIAEHLKQAGYSGGIYSSNYGKVPSREKKIGNNEHATLEELKKRYRQNKTKK